MSIIEFTKPDSDVKDKIQASHDRLFKSRQINPQIDEIELSTLVNGAITQPLSSDSDILVHGGFLAEDLIKPRMDLENKLKLNQQPHLLASTFTRVIDLGEKCLFNGGVLGDPNIGRFPTEVVGKNSYMAAANILDKLSQDSTFRNFISQQQPITQNPLMDLSVQEISYYLRTFSTRFQDYIRILKSAQLTSMGRDIQVDDRTGIYLLGTKQKLQEHITNDELIRRLDLPRIDTFHGLIRTASKFEPLFSYSVDASVNLESSNVPYGLEIDSDFEVHMSSTLEDKYIFPSVMALKKALFLMHTYYKDNDIEISNPINYVFTSDARDELKERILHGDLAKEIDETFEKELLSKLSSFFWHMGNERRIRHKAEVWEKLEKKINTYESNVAKKALALSGPEYDAYLNANSDGSLVIDLMKFSALNIIHGLESVLHTIPIYDKERSTPQVKNEIGSYLTALRKYNDILSSYSQFFFDADEDLIGGSINAVSRSINDPKLLEDMVADSFGTSRKLMKKIIVSHAEIQNVHLDKKYAYRLFEKGENIEFVFQLAKTIKSEMDHYVNFNQLPMDRPAYVGTVEKHVADMDILLRTEDIPAYLSENLADNIAKTVWRELSDLIKETSEPFMGLKEKLSILGIPEILGLNVENKLKEMYTGEEKIDIKPINSPASVLIDDPDFTDMMSAISEIFKRVSPNSITQLSYSQYMGKSPIKNLALADGAISAIRIIDGKPIEVYHGFINPGQEFLFEETQRMFPDADVYYGTIGGVAMALEMSKGGNLRLKGSKFADSMPPVFQLYGVEETGLDEILANSKTRFHEFNHCLQGNKRHNWRRIMALYSELLIDFSLKKMDQGIDQNIPFFSSNFVRFDQDLVGKTKDQRLTYNELIITVLDDFAKVAIGVGDKAERMRQDGFYEGISITKNIFPGLHKPILHDISTIQYENSDISKMVHEIYTALKQRDKTRLKELKKECKNYHEELTTIEETSAEVMSLFAFQNFTQELATEYPNLSKYFLSAGVMAKEEFYALAKVTRAQSDIFDEHRDSPGTLNRELNKIGYKYQKHIHYYNDIEPQMARFLEAGVPEFAVNLAMFDTHSARKQYSQIAQNPEHFFVPVNEGRVFINKRYRVHIPDMINHIEMFGNQAWETIYNAESIDQACIPMDNVPIIGQK